KAPKGKKGSKSHRAYGQYTAEDPHTEPTTLTIEGASNDAPPFKRVKKSITSRLRTFTEVSWVVSSWPTEKAAGPDQRSPELSAVIQEIVDRPRWGQQPIERDQSSQGGLQRFRAGGAGVAVAEGLA